MQVTRDLASFWARGYAEVRKELKGTVSAALLARRSLRCNSDAQGTAARAMTRYEPEAAAARETPMIGGHRVRMNCRAVPAMPRCVRRLSGPSADRGVLAARLHAVSTWAAEGAVAAAQRAARRRCTAKARRSRGLRCAMSACPYRYGGADPHAGFDCSGLVSYVHGQRWHHRAAHGRSTIRCRAARSSESDLRPGDLVFFRLHRAPATSRTSGSTRVSDASCMRRRRGATSASPVSTRRTTASAMRARAATTCRRRARCRQKPRRRVDASQR